MNGAFLDLEAWLKRIEENHSPREISSEGARWWLSRIKQKEPAI